MNKKKKDSAELNTTEKPIDKVKGDEGKIDPWESKELNKLENPKEVKPKNSRYENDGRYNKGPWKRYHNNNNDRRDDRNHRGPYGDSSRGTMKHNRRNRENLRDSTDSSGSGSTYHRSKYHHDKGPNTTTTGAGTKEGENRWKNSSSNKRDVPPSNFRKNNYGGPSGSENTDPWRNNKLSVQGRSGDSSREKYKSTAEIEDRKNKDQHQSIDPWSNSKSQGFGSRTDNRRDNRINDRRGAYNTTSAASTRDERNNRFIRMDSKPSSLLGNQNDTRNNRLIDRRDNRRDNRINDRRGAYNNTNRDQRNNRFNRIDSKPSSLLTPHRNDTRSNNRSTDRNDNRRDHNNRDERNTRMDKHERYEKRVVPLNRSNPRDVNRSDTRDLVRNHYGSGKRNYESSSSGGGGSGNDKIYQMNKSRLNERRSYSSSSSGTSKNPREFNQTTTTIDPWSNNNRGSPKQRRYETKPNASHTNNYQTDNMNSRVNPWSTNNRGSPKQRKDNNHGNNSEYDRRGYSGGGDQGKHNRSQANSQYPKRDNFNRDQDGRRENRREHRIEDNRRDYRREQVPRNTSTNNSRNDLDRFQKTDETPGRNSWQSQNQSLYPSHSSSGGTSYHKNFNHSRYENPRNNHGIFNRMEGSNYQPSSSSSSRSSTYQYGGNQRTKRTSYQNPMNRNLNQGTGGSGSGYNVRSQTRKRARNDENEPGIEQFSRFLNEKKKK